MDSSNSDYESLAREAAQFATTRWSVIVAAGESTCAESREALEKLCRTYWYPLYAFARRKGHSRPDAEDLVQEFLARLLEKQYVSRADPARGKFRSFLLSSFRHFLTNEWDRQQAVKRGGRNQFLSWEDLSPEGRYAADAGDGMTPERVYERTWALSVLSDVRTRLREEAAANGNGERFELLEQFLPGAASGLSYEQLAALVGTPKRLHCGCQPGAPGSPPRQLPALPRIAGSAPPRAWSARLARLGVALSLAPKPE